MVLEAIWISLYWMTPLRENSALFVALMLVAFAIAIGCFLMIPLHHRHSLAIMLGFGLVFRLTVLPAHPDQSEDVYRYLWDARVAAHGLDPYAHPPDAPELAGVRQTPIYDRLNSKPYITAYPPLSQALFRAARTVFGERVVPIKAVFALLEFCSLLIAWRLLAAFGQRLEPLYLMAWNPFFIFEFSHSGHSDSSAMFLVLMCVWLIHRRQRSWAGAAYAGAVLSKLHPALWFPMLLRAAGWRAFLAGTVTGCLLLAFYFSPSSLLAYVTSLQAYVRVFEFNGSVYNLARFFVQKYASQPWGVPVGSLLAIILLGIAVIVCVRTPVRSGLDVLRASFWIMTADLCLATTVHPWYLSWAAVSLFVFPYAFMAWWTGAVFLSYLAYAYRPVHEATWVLLVEYVPVYALMAWEVIRGRPLLPDLLERTSRRDGVSTEKSSGSG